MKRSPPATEAPDVRSAPPKNKEAQEARKVVALLKGALASFESIDGHKEVSGVRYAIDLIERAYLLKPLGH